MHELAVCQSLIKQVEKTAAEYAPCKVAIIVLKIGPLSGIEMDLLNNAFSIAKMGTVAEFAELKIEKQAVVVYCKTCDKNSEVKINNLSCPACGNWQTQLISGNEMLLQTVELDEEE